MEKVDKQPKSNPEDKDVNWSFHSEGNSVPSEAAQSAGFSPQVIDPVEWTASEYVSHQKDNSWYVMAVGGGVLLSGIIFLFTRDLFSTAMVIVAVGIFIAAAARPPRVLSYMLDSKGITIGRKFYSYEKFKAFSVINEGVLHSISLDPLERFMPNISVYFDPNDEQKITNVLGTYLPFEAKQQTPVDKLMHKIRF